MLSLIVKCPRKGPGSCFGGLWEKGGITPIYAVKVSHTGFRGWESKKGMAEEGSGLAGVWPECMQILRVRGSNVRFQILWRSSIGREEKFVRGEGGAGRVELTWVTFWIQESFEAAWNSSGLFIVINCLGLRND